VEEVGRSDFFKRFNGLEQVEWIMAKWETVKTVSLIETCFVTGLKPGVNEIVTTTQTEPGPNVISLGMDLSAERQTWRGDV
jgi:hypothetical protein